jgi:trk system potassium uptake protein TrkA
MAVSPAGELKRTRAATTRGARAEVHVIIAGCGRVGSELASNLERLGHSVTVIDKHAKAFERLKAGFSGTKIVGFAFDREILEGAGIKDAAAFASVTNGDNSNILSARVAKEHYRVPQVVARIYDPRRAQIYQRLGIQTVATVRWTTDQILRYLLPEEVSVEYTVDNGEVVVTALPAPPEVVGKKVLDVDILGRRRVVAVSRFGVPRVPDKDLTVQEGDILHISVIRADCAELGEEIKTVGRPE